VKQPLAIALFRAIASFSASVARARSKKWPGAMPGRMPEEIVRHGPGRAAAGVVHPLVAALATGSLPVATKRTAALMAAGATLVLLGTPPSCLFWRQGKWCRATSAGWRHDVSFALVAARAKRGRQGISRNGIFPD
jgi:hypothetical protein